MIKTRFAPSPTGYLHVGGLRTALYAYLFAKQKRGKLVLRIEDTDQERFVEGAMENLMHSLDIMGIEFDEGPYLDGANIKQRGDCGPYIQSQRTDIYSEYAQKLLDSGHAYRCFCTRERLDEMREMQKAKKMNPMYDRKCAYLSQEEIDANLAEGLTYVIRMKVPQDQVISFEDMVRGRMEFKGHTVDDQVLVKSDGFPTYHLANVVDDHLMGITHVIRGEEWLPSTPKHVALYQAFGWEPPVFAHLSLLLNPDKSKLSKRQGDVAVEDYLKKGYLVEALNNFIALLGWNPGTDEEIFSMQQLIEQFDFAKVQKSGAVFDHEKLDWMNGKYLREMDFGELTLEVLKVMDREDWFENKDDKYFEDALRSVYQKFKRLIDAPQMMKFYFLESFDYDKSLFINEKMKIDEAMAQKALKNSIAALENLSEEEFQDEERTKEVLTAVITAMEVKNGQVLWPVRAALSNEQYSPGVFELLRVMGKERSLNRMKAALNIF